MKTKDQVARELAMAHSSIEPSVAKIVRLISDREDQADEPIKLLELNLDTIPSGIVPVFFGPSDEIPFPSVVVEVTQKEFAEVETHKILLPDGWKQADVLFERHSQN
jgi:hypothetical protein